MQTRDMQKNIKYLLLLVLDQKRLVVSWFNFKPGLLKLVLLLLFEYTSSSAKQAPTRHPPPLPLTLRL